MRRAAFGAETRTTEFGVRSETDTDHCARESGRTQAHGRFGPGLGRLLRDGAFGLVLAAGLFVGLRATVVEAFKIPTSSMEGTLLVGDFLFVNKAVYGIRLPWSDRSIVRFRDPSRGEVVVFHPPHELDKHYVKRLVGVPGDTLHMKNKRLFVNGRPQVEAYTRFLDRRGDAVHPDMEWQSNHLIASIPDRYHPTRDNWGPLVVPAGRYFVLGDNRDNSEDSRYWGFVDREQIRGRPWIIYYSAAPGPGNVFPRPSAVRWGRLGQPIR